MQLRDARVLVVGATGVLGGALARALVDEGCRVALTGRDGDRLAILAADLPAPHTAVLDLVDVEACATVVREAAAALGGLDAVVLASGVAAFGPAEADDDAIVEELFAVNVLGPMAVVRTSLGELGAGGAVAVVSAILADMPVAGMAAYSATKAALSAYLTAVRREVRRRKITVLDVRPPHMDTGLADRALAGDPPRMPAGYDLADVVARVVEGLADGRAELVYDDAEKRVVLR